VYWQRGYSQAEASELKMRSKIQLVALLLGIAIMAASRNSHGQYIATSLHPIGFLSTEAVGIFGGQIVGVGQAPATGDHSHALVWDKATSQYVDLHPTGFEHSIAYDTNGSVQVGIATTVVHGPQGTVHKTQAMLWHGSEASAVNLHPAGVTDSYAYATSGASQVGYGLLPGRLRAHALLWHGSADSVVDLHPAEYFSSSAAGVDGDFQVGDGIASSGLYHAMLWNGTAASAVNLNPIWADVSSASDVSGDDQVGVARRDGRDHAVLWNGSADSAIDLHPEGFDVSYGVGISGDFQVGRGWGPATGGSAHALVWRRTAESVFDLHNSLAEVVPGLVLSAATDVDVNGDIVGYALAGNYYYAVKWTSVPEPTALVLALLALCVPVRRRRARVSSHL
jgi:hypothetical protein